MMIIMVYKVWNMYRIDGGNQKKSVLSGRKVKGFWDNNKKIHKSLLVAKG